MLKRSILIESKAYLRLHYNSLILEIRKDDSKNILESHSVPIEDIGMVILDNPQITITQALLSELINNNVALISTSSNHMPNGMWLVLEGNSLVQERFTTQIKASAPLNKQLWQQTIISKITNQGKLLTKIGIRDVRLSHLSQEVKSGDSDNREAVAAAAYWKKIFSNQIPGFTRDSSGAYPNNLLNYGYSILRACTARSLVGTGLLCTLGIHHHNRYNAFALADDIMEPYRPFVDLYAYQWLLSNVPSETLSTAMKKHMLSVLTADVFINGETSPLMNGMIKTATSLAKCYEGSAKKIMYPILT